MFLQALFALHSGLLALSVEAKICGGLQGVYVCNPVNPSRFDICIGEQKYTLKCPTGLHFNTGTQVCDWPKNSDCGRPDRPSPLSQAVPKMKKVYTNPFASPLRQGSSDQRHTSSVNRDGRIRSRYEEGLSPIQTIKRPRYTFDENSRDTFEKTENEFRRRINKSRRNRNLYSQRNAQRQSHRGETVKNSQQKSNNQYRKAQDGYVHSNTNAAQKHRFYNQNQRFRNGNPTAKSSRHHDSDAQIGNIHTGVNSSDGFRNSDSYPNHWLTSHNGIGGSRPPRPNKDNSYRYSALTSQGSSRRFGLYDNSQSQQLFHHTSMLNPKPVSSRLRQGSLQQSPVFTKSITAAAAGRPPIFHQPPNSASAAASAGRHTSGQRLKSFPQAISAAAAAAPQRQHKPRKTGKCSPETCQPPDCRCVGSDIPGGLPVHDVPQMIMLTFDDSVNSANFGYYRQIYGGKFHNPNGCPIKSTFYVSGDATDYPLVDKLHKQGHEIASHSLSHRSPSTFWADAGYDGWVNEIEGMRRRLSDKSKIPVQDIRGIRAPFLQLGGDDQYQMLEDFGYLYDTSMVTGHLYKNQDPPIWPFTLDYPPDSKICTLSPCPTGSYPGLWEIPLVRWYGENRIACAMPDSCTTGYGRQGSLEFLVDNFSRHYQSNRSPLGIFLHASWFRRQEGNLEGLLDFLQMVTRKKDVWVVTVTQVIDWMKNPVPNNLAGSLPSWSCE